jgi:hypothetical protein
MRRAVVALLCAAAPAAAFMGTGKISWSQSVGALATAHGAPKGLDTPRLRDGAAFAFPNLKMGKCIPYIRTDMHICTHANIQTHHECPHASTCAHVCTCLCSRLHILVLMRVRPLSTQA